MSTLEPRVVGVSLDLDDSRGVVRVRVTEQQPGTEGRVAVEVFAAKDDPENIARACEVTLQYAEKMRGQMGGSSIARPDRDLLPRALGELQVAYEEAVERAAAAQIQRDDCGANMERLRELIRAVVEQVEAGRTHANRLCPGCATASVHLGGCYWPAIVAEASKA
jgi:hypothetical protein